MRRLRRTKIVATLGPASSERGDDRAAVRGRRRRVPHQHEPHARMTRCASCVAAIRAVEKDHGRPIGILVDLQGPKLRVGTFAGGSAMLENGATFTLDADPSAGRRDARAPAASGNLRGARSPATRCCSTTARSGSSPPRRRPKQRDHRAVEVGGKLSDRKGVSLPDTTIAVLGADRRRTAPISKPRSTPASTGSALSFIQRPEDIAEAKKITRGRAAVMAKIEKPQAVHAARRDHRPHRRADGGARRSRRRNAAGEGAGHPEADHARRAPRRQAGGGRDADARNR